MFLYIIIFIIVAIITMIIFILLFSPASSRSQGKLQLAIIVYTPTK